MLVLLATVSYLPSPRACSGERLRPTRHPGAGAGGRAGAVGPHRGRLDKARAHRCGSAAAYTAAGPFSAAGSRHRCSLCYPCVAFTVPVLPTLSALRLPLHIGAAGPGIGGAVKELWKKAS